MPQNANIQVFEETIDVTLPSTSVKMLIAQPYLEFRQPLQEPFALLNQCSSRLLSGIDNVFAVSRTFEPHVILFPEFSLPGIDAVDRVKTALLSNGSSHPLIVVGGVHGLSQDEYTRVCSLPDVEVHVCQGNGAAAVAQTQWVNTSVTFVKEAFR